MDGLKFALKKLPARTVVGIAHRTRNADAQGSIPGCWKEFLAGNMVAKIPHRAIPPVMYAVYSDYEKDWTGFYSYLLGCGVTRAETVPAGMEARHIPPQTYAVFRAKGRMPDEITQIWANVWASGLPRTYTYDFELYDKRFARPNAKEAEVWVAIDPSKMEQAAGS
jgi:predicted transcriptional regulator YdeE